jgi:hypothetical protein
MIATLSVRSLRVTAALCAALLLVVGARVNAGLLRADQLPTFTISAEGAESAWTWTPRVDAFEPVPDGYLLRNAYQAAGALHGRADVTVDLLRYNPDPFVLNNILVTNTSATTQVFTAFVGFPTTFAAPNNLSGTITTSVIDETGNGATIAEMKQ